MSSSGFPMPNNKPSKEATGFVMSASSEVERSRLACAGALGRMR